MRQSSKKWFAVFVLPTFAAFCIAFLVPFIIGLYLSFCEFRTVGNAQFVGLQNYIRAFSENNEFINSLWFTIKFAVMAVISINVIAFILALLLTKGIRGTNIFRTVFFMPNLIGGIVLGYIWQLIINGILYKYGYSITSNPKFGYWGLVVLMSWQMIGYMMIIYIAGIQNINSFKLFDQNLALTAGAPSKQTQMVALDIYNTFYGRVGSEGIGQAKAVVFFILVAVIALLQLYFTRSREVEN